MYQKLVFSLTVGGETPNRFAAARKPRVSRTAKKADGPPRADRVVTVRRGARSVRLPVGYNDAGRRYGTGHRRIRS